MANMHFNNVDPNSYYRRTFLVEGDPIVLFIEEVIDYSLREHNLTEWIPPVNISFARSVNEIKYFNSNFAKTVISPGVEADAVQKAHESGFDDNVWLGFLSHEDARNYQQAYLSYIHYCEKPFLFKIFSFACYASRIAYENNRHSLIKDVVWALHAILCEIIPNEETFRQINFVANANNLHSDNQSHDDDEGYLDRNASSSSCFIDSTFLFVEELINYSLSEAELHDWIPPIDLEALRGIEMDYSTTNIGAAIGHELIENSAIHEAELSDFDEERWLEINRPSEARGFMEFFLRRLFNPDDPLSMLSFACYCSKQAMRRKRNGLVNEVVLVLFRILSELYPLQENHRRLDSFAIHFNRHRQRRANSDDDDDDDDDGFENEIFAPEENNED